MDGEVEGKEKGLELMQVWVLMCFPGDPLFHSFHYFLSTSLIQKKVKKHWSEDISVYKEIEIYGFSFQKPPVNIPRYTTYCLHQNDFYIFAIEIKLRNSEF